MTARPLTPPTQLRSPLRWNRVRTAGVEVEGAIVHSMAERVVNDSSRWGPVGMFDAADWLDRKNVSAHAIISTTGAVVELVSPELVAFHAGKSRFEGWTWLNANFLGCEFLVRGDHDYGSWLQAIDDVECYTSEQYNAGGWLFATWAKRYGFLPSVRIVGHEEVAGDDVRGAGKGKRDPGSGFDWNRFRTSVVEWLAELDR